jgi:enoyl-CoA hydratase/carnithine racemase
MTDLLIDTTERVMTITFARLHKKNALTRAMYADMADALYSAENDDTVHAVVFQGHETVFSAGNDLGDFAVPDANFENSPVFLFMQAISRFPKPLLAAVCGPAVGIGTTLLLHCDLVYAGDNAAFAMPFVNLGLCPEAASSLLAPLRMGYGRAAQALLLGEPFSAEDARDMGLVARIVPPTEVTALAQVQARKLAAKPLTSLLETKRLMKLGLKDATAARISEEATIFARMLGEPAAREAVRAFTEKRAPDFSRC